ncbi:hypothetical protein BCR15_00395 [Tessaracoccus lapidicaptus]|uniref:DUF222 domain-containing protein n=2 Tax=Tessaracoccus lapidicaptus TaxID=1427523 RepID=A0A1C0APQ6_9ACTN|nr:hypothetical protein BCR15_00395 [Tessaracoccus lapidicaptus]
MGVMTEVARRIAEQLRSADELRRVAEANTVALLCELAEEYSVGCDEVHEILAERKVTVGGAGTPGVSEFIALELAGLLRCTPMAAATKLADALNLKYRHPELFRAVRLFEVEPARACKAADLCSGLPQEVAEQVTSRWLGRQGKLGWTAAFNWLKKLIIEADPARAAAREVKQRADRGVHVWGLYEGVMNLTGRLDVLDARYLDAAVDRVADILAVEQPEQTRTILRAKALGVLANPAYALALLQRAAQPSLLDDPVDDPVGDPAFEAGGQRHDPHCLGALCGTITAPLSRLRPTLELAVHIHTDAVGRLTGAARVDKAGHITTALLAELLPGLDVKVQPVIDLPELPAEDQYVPSVPLKRGILLAFDNDMFLYRQHRSQGLDVDHTRSHRPGRRGQTRVGNLAPLGRTAHRAKTNRAWRVDQPRPGQLIWSSPLGLTYEVTTTGTRPLD